MLETMMNMNNAPESSQNSFMIVANTAIELEEILKTRKTAKNPIQPCLLIA
ncbi:Uncharacterized protein FWK35_00030576, partial [Aphis craccivora]